jgi:hypothetical protein
MKRESDGVNTRTYEVTWDNGKRQRLEEVTAVYVSRGNSVVVSFYGPLPEGGWAGRLLLSAVMGASVVAVRDVDADIQTVVAEAQPRSRWRGPLGKRRR